MFANASAATTVGLRGIDSIREYAAMYKPIHSRGLRATFVAAREYRARLTAENGTSRNFHRISPSMRKSYRVQIYLFIFSANERKIESLIRDSV